MRGRSDRGHGERRDVYVILLQSDTVQSYGRAKADTRSVGVDLGKKTKDLSASERVERGHGEGVSTEDVRESVLCTYDVVYSRKETRWHL